MSRETRDEDQRSKGKQGRQKRHPKVTQVNPQQADVCLSQIPVSRGRRHTPYNAHDFFCLPCSQMKLLSFSLGT